eukprot:2534411-Prymnesium_polylepis.1
MSKSQLPKREWSEDMARNVRAHGCVLRESAKAVGGESARQNVCPKVAKAAKVAAFWEAESCKSDLPSKATLKLRNATHL